MDCVLIVRTQTELERCPGPLVKAAFTIFFFNMFTIQPDFFSLSFPSTLHNYMVYYVYIHTCTCIFLYLKKKKKRFIILLRSENGHEYFNHSRSRYLIFYFFEGRTVRLDLYQFKKKKINGCLQHSGFQKKIDHGSKNNSDTSEKQNTQCNQKLNQSVTV